MTFGPDGCIYAAAGTTVFRITDSGGGCSYGGAALSSPTLVLSPTAVSPNPLQGTSQTFNAAIHYANAPTGTQVLFSVTGANPQVGTALTNGNGQASFSYTAVETGQDTITATATVNSSTLASNQATVTWSLGTRTSFLSLNQSPISGAPGQMPNLVASLTDVSNVPPVPLINKMINFSLDGSNCSTETNYLGIATCRVTLGSPGVSTLSATFPGDSGFLTSSASEAFDVIAAPAVSATATAAATATATSTATATATPTAVATLTATATANRTATATATGTATATQTATATATRTAAATGTRTATPTATRTATATETRTATATATATRTATTPTSTATATATSTATEMATPTATATPISTLSQIYLIPPELDFGSCVVGRRGTTLIALLFNPWWNKGPATINSITIQGSVDFSIDAAETTCKSTLAMGGTCAIAIQFNPLAGGSLHAKLIVHDNASNSPQVVILEGFGGQP
jgi:hypothetical protein